MSFIYSRTVRFQETDAAGVVYFANVLAMCHEAYEASLVAAGFALDTFFGPGETAVPIVHASVDLMKPMVCGDRLHIRLTTHLQHETEFEITYQIFQADVADKLLSTAITRHVCIAITPRSRRRAPLPPALRHWVESLAPLA